VSCAHASLSCFSLLPVQFLGFQPGYSHVLLSFVNHFVLAIVLAIVQHKGRPSATPFRCSKILAEYSPPFPGVQNFRGLRPLTFSGVTAVGALTHIAGSPGLFSPPSIPGEIHFQYLFRFRCFMLFSFRCFRSHSKAHSSARIFRLSSFSL
jgi:hypothetical protein